MRHAEYEQPEGVPSAHLPHPLTPAGRRQAVEAAERLAKDATRRGWTIARVIDCSRMLRAWQTAETVAAELAELAGKPFEVAEFDALAERGLGGAANLTIEQIEAAIARDPRAASLPKGWKTNSRFRLPLQGAESLVEAGERVAAHLERRLGELVAGAGAADTVKLFVGHGGAFRHAALALGVLEEGEVGGLSMHHCRPVYLERRADGGWEHVAGQWKARRSAAEEVD